MPYSEDPESSFSPRSYATLSLVLEEVVIPVGIVVFLPQGLDVPVARSARAHLLRHYPQASPGQLAALPHVLQAIAGQGTPEERYQRLAREGGIQVGPRMPLTATTLAEYEQEIIAVLADEIPDPYVSQAPVLHP